MTYGEAQLSQKRGREQKQRGEENFFKAQVRYPQM